MYDTASAMARMTRISLIRSVLAYAELKLLDQIV
jgi:hypothetical protein